MNMNDVISIMTKTKASYLATLNSEGYPEIRALLNLVNEKKYPKLKDKALSYENETVTVYFTTNTSSRKVAQLRGNNRVSLYYCIPDKFQGACLTGTVEIIDDPEVKKSFWQTGWRIYYPKGCTDPDYALCKFTSKSIHCWGGFGVHNFGEAPACENVTVFA